MKDIKIVSATNKKLEHETLLYETIDFYETQESENYIRYKMYCNNTESLAKIYNKEITLNNSNKIVVFVHDDVVIEDLFLVDKLNEAMQQFDIIGLAGIKAPIALKNPALWHLMGPPTQYSEAVAHFEKNGPRRFMTTFGPTPERVVLLDGVFLAINTERILEKGLKFDEKNPAKFHFYDMNFCIDANKLGLKLGTWPIWITHKSHGLETVSKDWLVGQDYLLQKYT